MDKAFINSLPIVAAALGEKSGVRVVFEGTGAKTNGSTIFLPALPEDDAQALILARGYIDHESAHVRETNFKHWTTGITASLANIFEDIRIEQLTMRQYPGSRKNLNDLVKAVHEEGGFSPDSESNPFAVIHNFLLTRARVDILGNHCLDVSANACETALKDMFPDDLVSALNDIKDRSGKLSSTAEAVSLAEEVIRTIEDKLDDLAQEANEATGNSESGDPDTDDDSSTSAGGGQSESGEDGSGNDPEAGSTSTDSDTSADRESGEADAHGSAGEESESESDGSKEQGASASEAQTDKSAAQPESDSAEGSGNGGLGDQGKDSALAQEQAEVLEKALSDWHQHEGRDLGSMAEKMLEQHAEDNPHCGKAALSLDPSVTVPPNGVQAHAVTREEVAKCMQALRVKLASKLRAQRERVSTPKRHGRRIERRVIHRIPMGDSRVFKAKRPKELPNTGIALLLDQSGSMSREKELATQACYAFSLAVEGTKGVELCVGGYSGAMPNGNEFCAQISLYKDVGESVRHKPFYPMSVGSTPSAEAVWWAAHKLTTMRGIDRALIINITDGDPDCHASMCNAVSKVTRAGIEVIGLGIDQIIRPEHAARATTISNIGEMPRKLFEILEQELVRNVG